MSKKGRRGDPSEAGRGARAAVPGADVLVVQQSDLGRVRPHNEDYAGHQIPQDPHELERKGIICLVADGMGGHQAGEVASKQAVEFVTQQYYSDVTHDVGTSLVRAFRAANRLIYEQAQADPTRAGMGTTLVGAVILGKKVYVANVGDSRAYLIGSKGPMQITEDHSWVGEQVRAGLLTQEQARQHPQRNLVTRALGPAASVEVDLFEGTLAEGDSLVLCSDGLSNYVNGNEIEQAVRGHPPQEAIRSLIETAKERGGADNITVLIVSGRKQSELALAPQPQAKRARPFPVVPVALGAVALLALAALAVWLVPTLIKPKASPTAIATPAGTVTVGVTAQVSPSAAPVVISTVGDGATETPGTPLSTATLVPTSTVAVTAPTPTAPTPTAPTPTAVPLPTATASPGPTASPAVYPAVTLLEPIDPGKDKNSGTLHGSVTFKWSYSQPLAAGLKFQVLIWRAGLSERLGAAEAVPCCEQTIDLAAVPVIAREGDGQYYWMVVVVDETAKRLSPETGAWEFQYNVPAPQLPDYCNVWPCNACPSAPCPQYCDVCVH